MQLQSTVSPVIAIVGLQRVGSMWSYNVARALIQGAGLELMPDQVPKTDPEMFSAAELYLKSRPINTRCVIKVHATINPSPSVKVIRNSRDLRDRLFSLCRFMKYSFDEHSVSREISRSLEVDSHYDRWPAESILNISFESIETDSIELIRQIAEFIDLPATNTKLIRKIAVQLSKQRVKKRIAEIDDRVFDRDGNVRSSAHPDAVLEFKPGHVRAFDVTSGFQSGHISDYQSGDWGHLWTDREKQIVDDAIRAAQRKRELSDAKPGHQ